MVARVRSRLVASRRRTRSLPGPRWKIAGAAGRSVLAGGVAVVVLAAGQALVSPAAAAAGSDSPWPAARTDTGLVRGTHAAGVEHFLGLPYAQPPVGELRWRPPAPASAWEGVRQATAYGNRCPAQTSMNGPRSDTEDCLYLNVHRPATARPGQRLPVYVWIHGGGLIYGSANQHDGTMIAHRAGVIVVTINYRLGLFGFLAHPALTQEAGQSGNYGLLDQQAALRWVQRNIAAFGGDPRQVTLGGESAGGQSVCAHLSAPGSQGLFAKAIIQSGSCVSQTLGQAEQSGTSIAAALGCADTATAARCLRDQSAARLVDVTPPGGEGILFVRQVPALPQDPGAAVRAGRFARVPVLIGANRDEGRTFTVLAAGWTQHQYETTVRARFADRGDAVLARYPWPATTHQFTAAYLTGAFYTDAGLLLGIGGCPNLELTRVLAEHTRTYAYQFDHRTGPGLLPDAPAGYIAGAGHGAELAYTWPSFHWGVPIAPTFDTAERQLAADMAAYWGAFIRSGAPRTALAARWPAFTRTRQVLSLRAGGRSRPILDTRLAAQHQCGFWTPTGDNATRRRTAIAEGPQLTLLAGRG
jgi:carboxylesterase type B